MLRGARFTPKGTFGSIYLASDPFTALKETQAFFPGLTIASHPWTLLTVVGSLAKVLDLTDTRIHELLGTSLAELTGEWMYSQRLFLEGKGSLPPTQLLGRTAHATGRFTGLRYHSTKNLGEGIGFVVFPDRLSEGSFLEVHDPHGWIRQRLP